MIVDSDFMAGISEVPHQDIRILIADRYPVVSNGIRYELEKFGGLDVVGITVNGVDTLRQAMRLQPDILITDIAFPDLNGIELTQRLNEEMVGMGLIQVLAFTDIEDKHYVWGMLAAGAKGYLLKNEPVTTLIDGVRMVARGQIALSLSVQTVIVGLISSFHQTLSERENEIIALVGRGLSNKEIGHALNISEATVNQHITNVCHKLPTVRTRAEVVAWARINHLA